MIAHAEALNGKPPPKPRKRWTFLERYLPIIVIYLMVVALVGFLIAPQMFITVPSGHVGLLWKRFRAGTQLDPRQLRPEGLRVILPWDRLFLYDLQLRTTTDSYNAISKDGINLTATINIRFRLKHDSIPQLHQGIGPDYVARLLRPEIGNRMREIIAEYTAEEVYSTKRQEIQKRIRTHTEEMLGQSMMERTSEQSEYGEAYRVSLDTMINLYDTLILGLELPQPVIAAINRKVEQYYLVGEYTFRVERERKESERKQIEAQGISAFQQTVAQGISDSYLRWRGIEATLQLAQSNNAKIVIVGSGKDGLPIILGNFDAPTAPQPGGAHPPANNGATSNEKPTGPALPPLERTPAGHLSTPPEKPARQIEVPTEAPTLAPGKQSNTAPSEQRSSWPITLSDIATLLFGSTPPGEPQNVPKIGHPPTSPGAKGH